MSAPSLFKSGDRVRHPAKPEWGVGRVEQAQRITHEGREAQRVVVTFPNHGRVTLNTAFAALEPAAALPPINPAGVPCSGPREHVAISFGDSTRRGDADDATPPGASLADLLRTLPDAATDPFLPLPHRFSSTLDLYKHTTDARGLLDWAVMRTQADDPLSHFTRQELEQHFAAFAVCLDRHLKDLLRAAKKNGQQGLIEEASRHTNPAARQAVAAALRAI